MSNEQYSDGTVTLANASILVVGDGTDWKNEISLPAIFKRDEDGEATYSLATIISATRMHLSANYSGTSGSGLDYMIMRSFTSRGFWRPLQGDSDFAEILSQETIDKIDDDIALLFTSYSTGSAVGTNASTFAINMDATLGRFWTDNLTASRDYRLPNQNATLAGLGVAQEFSADQTFNASVHIKGNASIDGTFSVGNLGVTNLTVDDLNATTGDINTLHSATLTANDLNATSGDIATLHSDTLTANDLNATTGDIETLHSTTLTASDITASSMKVSDLTNNRIVIAGAGGELEDDANLTWDGSLLTVNGNMAVTGSTVIVTASNISVKDPLIILAKDQPGAPTFDSGLIVERGTSQNVGMFWDESAGKWVMAYTDEDGSTSGNITIASYGDLRVKGFQVESINASILNASTGDIHALHANTFTASTYTSLANANASIAKNAADIVHSNASIDTLQADVVRANASIDTLQLDIVRANASIDTSQADIVHINASITRANASIDVLQTDVIRANASIDISQADIVHTNASITRANASIDTLHADVVRVNASIDILQDNIANANASITTNISDISRNASDIVVANASIDILQSDMTRANASIATNIGDISNINASIANSFLKSIFNAKGDILTASADNIPSILSASTDGLVLTLDSTTIQGMKWAVSGGGTGDVIGPATNIDAYIPQWNGADSKTLKNGFAKTDLVLSALFNAKGDILTASADNTPSILSASTDGLVLTLDSSTLSGLKWSSVTTAIGPTLKTSDYQILTTDSMILASGNVTITLASASAKHEIRIGNRSLDVSASIRVKKSGGDTIENNASLHLGNKYDTVCLIGDGINTHFQF